MYFRRRTYRPDAITWADIEPEAVTGKQFRLPVKDKEGRAVLLMRPRSACPVFVSLTILSCPNYVLHPAPLMHWRPLIHVNLLNTPAQIFLLYMHISKAQRQIEQITLHQEVQS